jgi:hypothetical protein
VIKARLVAFALVLAVALSLLSVFIQRTGPARVQYGNLCRPNDLAMHLTRTT